MGVNRSVRIIGGRWRRRRVPFPDLPTLRPTPDRVRETLFNWLQPWITGARCLDLFAGSGALALEALSRDAAKVMAMDSHSLAVDTLRKNADSLGAVGLAVVQSDALEFLRQPATEQFDIVFMDPPYHRGLYDVLAESLDKGAWLSPTALVYVESPANQPWGGRSGWRLLRDKAAGRVSYRLFGF